MTPAPGQPRGGDADRPEWRKKLQADVGEDPAKYLDQPFTDAHGRYQVPELVEARIRGIDRRDVLGAWEAAERRHSRGADGGPREIVMGLLAERREFLDEHGERPDDVGAALADSERELPERYYPLPEPDDVEKPPVVRRDEDGDRYRLVSGRKGLKIERLDDGDADGEGGASA